MVEPYPPLLPWKVLGFLILALAAASGWTWSWDPFLHNTVRTLATVDALPRRADGGGAVLFLANSRLGFPLQPPGALATVLAGAGLPDAAAGLVVEQELTFSELYGATSRLAAFHPTVVVVQLDLFFPIAPQFSQPDAAHRLLHFTREGPNLATGLEIVDHLGARRRIAVDVPVAAHIAATLDATWASDRERAHQDLRDHGYRVISDATPWPDEDFGDGVHFDPTGAARFLRWLGPKLAAP